MLWVSKLKTVEKGANLQISNGLHAKGVLELIKISGENNGAISVNAKLLSSAKVEELLSIGVKHLTIVYDEDFAPKKEKSSAE